MCAVVGTDRSDFNLRVRKINGSSFGDCFAMVVLVGLLFIQNQSFIPLRSLISVIWGCSMSNRVAGVTGASAWEEMGGQSLVHSEHLIIIVIVVKIYTSWHSSNPPRIFSVFGNTVLFKASLCEDRPFFLVITKVFGNKERFGYYNELRCHGDKVREQRWPNTGKAHRVLALVTFDGKAVLSSGLRTTP